MGAEAPSCPSHGHQRLQLELGVKVGFWLRPADALVPGCICGVCASVGHFR